MWDIEELAVRGGSASCWTSLSTPSWACSRWLISTGGRVEEEQWLDCPLHCSVEGLAALRSINASHLSLLLPLPLSMTWTPESGVSPEHFVSVPGLP